MKNFNTILILVGILAASILIVENIVLSQQAFVFISRNSSTPVLAIVSIFTGMVLGFGIKGKIIERGDHGEEDSFNF
ncbi:hypothetical protein LR010_03425 [Candidatus Gracilibacteria bacterium]|nr:hypothetical protein [Candidatus Gracilibacteria bacterium]